MNPVEGLPIPKIEREEMRFLAADELWHLAETIHPRYRAFVLLGGYSGLRLGEMLGLRWGRVNLLRREVTVAETLTDLAGTVSFGPPKTKAAVRTVGVPSFVADELSKLPVAQSRTTTWCSSRRTARSFDRACSADASGTPQSTGRDYLPSESMICDIRPLPCGSLPAPTQSRSPFELGTRASPSFLTDTAISILSRSRHFSRRLRARFLEDQRTSAAPPQLADRTSVGASCER